MTKTARQMFPVIPAVTPRVTSSLSMQLCLTTEKKKNRASLGLVLRLHFSRDKTCRAGRRVEENSFRKQVAHAEKLLSRANEEKEKNESDPRIP